jgi:hypothetical protein
MWAALTYVAEDASVVTNFINTVKATETVKPTWTQIQALDTWIQNLIPVRHKPSLSLSHRRRVRRSHPPQPWFARRNGLIDSNFSNILQKLSVLLSPLAVCTLK